MGIYEIKFECRNKEIADNIKGYIDCLMGVKMCSTPKLIKS